MFVLREGTYSKGKRPNCNLGRHKFESYRTHMSNKLTKIFRKMHIIIINRSRWSLILTKLFGINTINQTCETYLRFIKNQYYGAQLFLLVLLSIYLFKKTNTAEIVYILDGYKKSILRNISWLYDSEVISFLHYVAFVRISHRTKEPVFIYLLITLNILLISAVFVFINTRVITQFIKIPLINKKLVCWGPLMSIHLL